MSGPDAGVLLLAIETATVRTGAALLRGETLVDEESVEGVPAAECLLPAIDALLSRQGIELPRLEALAVSVGPGSFTGLRIGVASAKGLGFGSDLRVAAVSTLEALALGAVEGRESVVATLDARRGELYAAGFDPPGGPDPARLAEGLYTPAELLAALPARCRIVGEADAVAGAALRAGLSSAQRLEAGPARLPRAREVGILGARQLARGLGITAAELVPRYIRRAEAEARRLRRPTEPGAAQGGDGVL